MQKDPALAQELQKMRLKFQKVLANPGKYKLKEIEIDAKKIAETEEAMRNSRKHSFFCCVGLHIIVTGSRGQAAGRRKDYSVISHLNAVSGKNES